MDGISKAGNFTVAALQTVLYVDYNGFFLFNLEDLSATDDYTVTTPIALFGNNPDILL